MDHVQACYSEDASCVRQHRLSDRASITQPHFQSGALSRDYASLYDVWMTERAELRPRVIAKGVSDLFPTWTFVDTFYIYIACLLALCRFASRQPAKVKSLHWRVKGAAVFFLSYVTLTFQTFTVKDPFLRLKRKLVFCTIFFRSTAVFDVKTPTRGISPSR